MNMDMFAKTKDALRNQILVIHHLVVLELIVWLMLLEMPFAGKEKIFDPVTCARYKYIIIWKAQRLITDDLSTDAMKV